MKKAIFAGVLLAMGMSAFAQVDPARVIATVNGVDIKGAEYYRRMEFLPGVGKNLGTGFAELPPGFMTLEQLITEKLVFQLAKEKGVLPTAPEIQDELAYRKMKDPKLVVNWLASGRTEQDLEYEIKFDLSQFNLLTAGITVTDQQVELYYKAPENRSIFLIPATATLRVIVVRSQGDADIVDKELTAGKAFADVAKAHSADMTSSTGGDYGTVPITYLSAQVQAGVLAVKPGQTTQWFGASDKAAMFKFLVEKVAPEQMPDLTPDLRRQTRQKIMMDEGKKKNHIKADLDALRTKAAIDIKDKGFADAYKRFMDAYLKTIGPSG